MPLRDKQIVCTITVEDIRNAVTTAGWREIDDNEISKIETGFCDKKAFQDMVLQIVQRVVPEVPNRHK
jgi:hypothetical protein